MEQEPRSGSRPVSTPSKPRVLELPEALTVRDLARTLRMSPIDVIKELMANGIVAGINQTIDYETAEIIARELGFETKPIQAEQPEIEEGELARSQTLWQRLLEDEQKKT